MQEAAEHAWRRLDRAGGPVASEVAAVLGRVQRRLLAVVDSDKRWLIFDVRAVAAAELRDILTSTTLRSQELVLILVKEALIVNISENAQAVDRGSVCCKELCLSLIIALQVLVEGLIGVELGDVVPSVQLLHYSVLVSEQTLGTMHAVAISAVEELAAVFALKMVPVHGHGPTSELFLLVSVDALSNLATPGLQKNHI